jgi:hypothetical protein
VSAAQPLLPSKVAKGRGVKRGHPGSVGSLLLLWMGGVGSGVPLRDAAAAAEQDCEGVNGVV